MWNYKYIHFQIGTDQYSYLKCLIKRSGLKDIALIVKIFLGTWMGLHIQVHKHILAQILQKNETYFVKVGNCESQLQAQIWYFQNCRIAFVSLYCCLLNISTCSGEKNEHIAIPVSPRLLPACDPGKHSLTVNNKGIMQI